MLPLYIPTLIFGALTVNAAALGKELDGSLIPILAITLGAIAILPFFSAMALRANLQ